jgi:hypothetical protein
MLTFDELQIQPPQRFVVCCCWCCKCGCRYCDCRCCCSQRGLLGRHAHISKASETQSRRSVPETEQQVLKHSMLPSSNIRSVDMGVRHAVTRAYHAAQPISRGQPRCSPRQAVKQCLTNMRDLCVLSKQLLMGRSCPPITLLPSCQQRHGLGLAAAHGKLPRRF